MSRKGAFAAALPLAQNEGRPAVSRRKEYCERPEFLSPRQFAKLVGICEESVYRLLSRRELRGIKFGRAWRLPVNQLLGVPGAENQSAGEREN